MTSYQQSFKVFRLVKNRKLKKNNIKRKTVTLKCERSSSEFASFRNKTKHLDVADTLISYCYKQSTEFMHGAHASSLSGLEKRTPLIF